MSKTVEFFALSSYSSSMVDSPPPHDDDDDRLSVSLDSGKGSAIRRRALSLAETQPTVETVVAKAKRAAQSLWMLLHAQNCVLGQKCPHTGCQEAKLLHLHLKTCQAGASGDAECPMLYHGCDQSRKLLAHYRRCRSLRARQVTSSNGKRAAASSASSSSPTSHHHCLICSLVARQAKTMLERKASAPMSGGNASSSIGGGKSAMTCVKKAAVPRKVSYTVSTEAFARGGSPRRNSLARMPPPPPKQQQGEAGGAAGAAASLDSLARLYETAKQLDGDDSGGEDTAVANYHKKGRNRAVSDAELLPQKRHNFYKTEDDQVMQTPDNEEEVVRRERSASEGHAPAMQQQRNASSLPPSCETIQEEPESPSKARATLEDRELPVDLAR